MNDLLVETWRYFQLYSSPVVIDASKKTSLVPITIPDEDTNTQSCLAASQTPKCKKAVEIEVIYRAITATEDVVVTRENYPMVLLIEKVKVVSPMNLLLVEASYNTVVNRTVITLQKIKET